MLYADHNFCVLCADRREYNRSVYFLEMDKLNNWSLEARYFMIASRDKIPVEIAKFAYLFSFHLVWGIPYIQTI
jgi:hypothetical protein